MNWPKWPLRPKLAVVIMFVCLLSAALQANKYHQLPKCTQATTIKNMCKYEYKIIEKNYRKTVAVQIVHATANDLTIGVSISRRFSLHRLFVVETLTLLLWHVYKWNIKILGKYQRLRTSAICMCEFNFSNSFNELTVWPYTIWQPNNLGMTCRSLVQMSMQPAISTRPHIV